MQRTLDARAVAVNPKLKTTIFGVYDRIVQFSSDAALLFISFLFSRIKHFAQVFRRMGENCCRQQFANVSAIIFRYSKFRSKKNLITKDVDVFLSRLFSPGFARFEFSLFSVWFSAYCARGRLSPFSHILVFIGSELASLRHTYKYNISGLDLKRRTQNRGHKEKCRRIDTLFRHCDCIQAKDFPFEARH